MVKTDDRAVRLNLTDDEIWWMAKAFRMSIKRDAKNCQRCVEKFGSVRPYTSQKLTHGSRAMNKFKNSVRRVGGTMCWEPEEGQDDY